MSIDFDTTFINSYNAFIPVIHNEKIINNDDDIITLELYHIPLVVDENATNPEYIVDKLGNLPVSQLAQNVKTYVSFDINKETFVQYIKNKYNFNDIIGITIGEDENQQGSKTISIACTRTYRNENVILLKSPLLIHIINNVLYIVN